MKLRALASISGPMGSHVAGEEFVVDAASGKELIDRRLAEAVEDAPAAAIKPPKAPGALKTRTQKV